MVDALWLYQRGASFVGFLLRNGTIRPSIGLCSFAYYNRLALPQASLLVGRGSLNQPFSAGDMLRERVSNNIGQASDEQVSRLALTEHVVVTIPANTPIYLVLEKNVKAKTASAGTPADGLPLSDSANTDELRQLLQLQRELIQTGNNEEE